MVTSVILMAPLDTPQLNNEETNKARASLLLDVDRLTGSTEFYHTLNKIWPGYTYFQISPSLYEALQENNRAHSSNFFVNVLPFIPARTDTLIQIWKSVIAIDFKQINSQLNYYQKGKWIDKLLTINGVAILIIFSLITIPIRLITLLPRMVYNRNYFHPLIHFLNSLPNSDPRKSIALQIVTEDIFKMIFLQTNLSQDNSQDVQEKEMLFSPYPSYFNSRYISYSYSQVPARRDEGCDARIAPLPPSDEDDGLADT